MLLTKEQISEQMCKHAQKKNGLHDLMEIMLESMMIAVRSTLTEAKLLSPPHRGFNRALALSPQPPVAFPVALPLSPSQSDFNRTLRVLSPQLRCFSPRCR